MESNNDGIFVLSVERVRANWKDESEFDYIETPSYDVCCWDDENDEWEDESYTEEARNNYAYDVYVNVYGKLKVYTIGLEFNDFATLMDAIRGVVNCVMIDTDTETIYQMFKETNYVYR